MSPDTWQTIGTIVALLLVGAYNAFRTRKVERQTHETGNGFAQEVKDALARIEGKGDATHMLMVKHLAAHADHDLGGT